MERTKHLVMDEKEKEEFARKGLEDKLRAIMRRFLEGMIGREELLAELGGMKAGRREKRLLLIDLVLEEFNLPGDKERLFDLLELVGEEAGGGLAGDARRLKDRFREELRANAAGVREEIMKRLATHGDLGDEPGAQYRRMGRVEGCGPKDRGVSSKDGSTNGRDKAENAPA